MKKHIPTAIIIIILIVMSGCGAVTTHNRYANRQQDGIQSEYDLLCARILKEAHSLEARLGCRLGVYFKDKELPVEVAFNADSLFHAASTMKTPVMIEVFRQADAGAFSLNDSMIVNPVCKSFLDNTTFVCDAKEYLNSILYKEASFRTLVEQMIDVSDNLATNILIERCGYKNINSTMRSLGAENGFVLRGVQDETAFKAGLSNRMTPRDLSILNEAIDRGTAGTVSSCEEMRDIMLKQQHNDLIPRLLPKDVRFAHKTGGITGVRHDSAIVYASFGTWYLTIMTEGLTDERAGEDAIASLSKFIYDEREKLAR